jgi:hypothetical protein
MASTLDNVHDDLNNEFSAPGGHVNWTDEYFDPVSAEAFAVATCLPDLIRWVLQNKGINITEGNCTIGHRTVSHWHYEGGGWLPRVKIPEPNRYVGFAAWKP